MTRLHRWKTGTAALMSLAITTGAISPMFVSAPVNAQSIFGQPRTVTISAGAPIPVTYEKDKVVVTPGESIPLTLKVASNLIDNNRNILIPAGTEIVGRLESVNRNSQKGVQFVAQELRFADGRQQSINATSGVITRTKKVRKGTDTTKILTDAAIGGGAATAISLITGNRRIEAIEPIIGAAGGALASVLLRRNEADLFVLNPEQDLNLTLRSSLVVSRR